VDKRVVGDYRYAAAAESAGSGVFGAGGDARDGSSSSSSGDTKKPRRDNFVLSRGYVISAIRQGILQLLLGIFLRKANNRCLFNAW
jgi:hypothetical protein